MGTTDTSQFRNGLKLDLDGQPYVITYFQHVKPGKGGAFVRTKLKNLRNGKVVDKTFRAGEKVEAPDIEERKMQFLYFDGDSLVFMDTESFEQTPISEEGVGEARRFLKENPDACSRLTEEVYVSRGLKLPVFAQVPEQIDAEGPGASDEGREQQEGRPREPRGETHDSGVGFGSH